MLIGISANSNICISSKIYETKSTFLLSINLRITYLVSNKTSWFLKNSPQKLFQDLLCSPAGTRMERKRGKGLGKMSDSFFVSTTIS